METLPAESQSIVTKLEEAIGRIEGVLGSINTDERTWPSPRHRKLFTPNEYIVIYTLCYDFCYRFSKSNVLYTFACGKLERFIATSVGPSLIARVQKSRISDQNNYNNNINLLVSLNECWTSFQILIKWYGRIFAYVERNYAVLADQPRFELVGKRQFREVVYEEMKYLAAIAITELIQNERDGLMIGVGHGSIIKSIVKFYEFMGNDSLKNYVNDFEPILLSATQEYYSSKGKLWLRTSSVAEYITMVDNAYTNEKRRVSEYLNAVTEEKILHVLDEELIVNAMSILLEEQESSCIGLMENDKIEDLRRMYRLFHRVDDIFLPRLAGTFQRFIESKCMDVLNQRKYRIESLVSEGNGDTVKEKNEDTRFITDMITLNKKYLEMVRDVFRSTYLFSKALNDSFVTVFNKTVGAFSSPDLLVSFSDLYLRTGTAVTDEDIESVLVDIEHLFIYLIDKDMFAEFYSIALAKRLLGQRCRSQDLEKSMISKLKTHCGAQYTSKMEGMLSDLAASTESSAAFKERRNQSDQLDFTVQVLTTGFWPTFNEPAITIPPQMIRYMDEFTAWHISEHPKRRLRWTMAQGSASVRGTFDIRRVYEFQVTTLQAAALVTFNEGLVFTYSDLAQRLNLPDASLKPLLHSLSCGKQKVIMKSPASNKIHSTDTFTANRKYASKQRKVRIPMAVLAFSSSTTQKVEENRIFAIEASIVRIMKARKMLSHRDLTAEVLRQLSPLFQPNMKDVRLRIESLIERAYLERSDDRASYSYLA